MLVLSFYFQITITHSSIISAKTVGYSHENRPIELISVALNSSDQIQKKAIFLECGIHSSEWISPALCLYVINKLVESKDQGL